jgi:hypothetical protein
MSGSTRHEEDLMAWSFGDGFDLYTAAADATAGYWDVGTVPSMTFQPGRFTGSQAWQCGTTGIFLTKTSGVNDAVHHLVVAFRQTAAITGSTLGGYLQLLDGATAQCSVVFRSDGAILLTSGGPAGTALATYTGAVAANNTWYQFEIEVVINNTTGSFKVRKNGNSVDDFSLGSLNTRVSANSYANKLIFGVNASVSQQQFDDLFWKSDAASVPWMGDIRCFTRMPASDQTAVFSRTPTGAYPLFTQNAISAVAANQGRYAPFTIGNNGSIGSVTVPFTVASTANFKCTIFSDNANAPGTALGSATPVSAPAIGTATFTFGTPVSVTAGTKYWVGVIGDAASGTQGASSLTTVGVTSASPTYAAFPASNPTVTTGVNPICFGIGITPAVNWPFVAEAQQDATTSYVYSSTVNDADFYGISSISSTPATVIACTTRAYGQKSDAGTRTMAVQVKSGATTVASPTLVLSSSGFQWAWRTDVTDPNTGAAWTPAAVNTVLIGPKTVA